MERSLDMVQADDFERARVEFKNALQLNAQNDEAYYQFGQLYESDGQCAEVFESYFMAVDRMPNHIDASMRLGRTCFVAGDIYGAPNRPELNFHLGAAHIAEARPDLARSYLEKAITPEEDFAFTAKAKELIDELPELQS